MSELDELVEGDHEGDSVDALTAQEPGEETKKKSKDTILKESSLAGVFTTPETSDPLKMLFSSDKVLLNLLMRGHHPSRINVIAASHILAQCAEFNDDIARKEVLMVMAGTCAIDGARARMLVDAYTGRESQKAKGGLGNWIREKAGFGTDEKGSQ